MPPILTYLETLLKVLSRYGYQSQNAEFMARHIVLYDRDKIVMKPFIPVLPEIVLPPFLDLFACYNSLKHLFEVKGNHLSILKRHADKDQLFNHVQCRLNMVSSRIDDAIEFLKKRKVTLHFEKIAIEIFHSGYDCFLRHLLTIGCAIFQIEFKHLDKHSLWLNDNLEYIRRLSNSTFFDNWIESWFLLVSKQLFYTKQKWVGYYQRRFMTSITDVFTRAFTEPYAEKLIDVFKYYMYKKCDPASTKRIMNALSGAKTFAGLRILRHMSLSKKSRHLRKEIIGYHTNPSGKTQFKLYDNMTHSSKGVTSPCYLWESWFKVGVEYPKLSVTTNDKDVQIFPDTQQMKHLVTIFSANKSQDAKKYTTKTNAKVVEERINVLKALREKMQKSTSILAKVIPMKPLPQMTLTRPFNKKKMEELLNSIPDFDKLPYCPVFDLENRIHQAFSSNDKTEIKNKLNRIKGGLEVQLVLTNLIRNTFWKSNKKELAKQLVFPKLVSNFSTVKIQNAVTGKKNKRLVDTHARTLEAVIRNGFFKGLEFKYLTFYHDDKSFHRQVLPDAALPKFNGNRWVCVVRHEWYQKVHEILKTSTKYTFSDHQYINPNLSILEAMDADKRMLQERIKEADRHKIEIRKLYHDNIDADLKNKVTAAMKSLSWVNKTCESICSDHGVDKISNPPRAGTGRIFMKRFVDAISQVDTLIGKLS